MKGMLWDDGAFYEFSVRKLGRRFTARLPCLVGRLAENGECQWLAASANNLAKTAHEQKITFEEK